MRLKATKKSDTALQTLRILTTSDSPLSGAALTKSLKTSTALLSQSLAPLIERGWINSRPGPDGGYFIAESLKKLSVLEVIEALEGPIINAECVVSDRRCGIDPACSLHHVWGPVRTSLRQALAKQSAI